MNRHFSHRLTAGAVAASALLASAGLPAHAAKPSPSISISSITVTEGDSGQTQMLFTLQVNRAWNNGMKVDYETLDGSAMAGSDYNSEQGTVSFASGKRQRLSIWANGDTQKENLETFTVKLTNPVGASIKPGGGLGTITNDDQLPDVSVDDVVVGEGDGVGATAAFKFTLSNASTTDVSLNYATADGTAVATDDYTPSSGTVHFLAGQQTRYVTIPIVGDTADESDETFTLNLFNPSGVALPDPQAAGTIVDDEGAPAVSVSDAEVTEGDADTVSATFNLVLSNAGGSASTVEYATSDGSATAPADYQAASGTVSFAAGQVGPKAVTVAVKGDDWNEAAEDFIVTLSSPTNAVLADDKGRGLIKNDDPTPNVSVSNTTVSEGNSGSVEAAFSLMLSRPSSQDVTITYGTSDDSAVATSDYTTATGSVTFAPGIETRMAKVAIIGDTLNEPAERFNLDVQSTTNSDLGDGAAMGTITNDDRAASKLSLKARKRPSRIRINGLLTPAHGGKKVKVVLKKRRSGAWVKVAGKRVLLGSAIDRNADGIRESGYRTKFRRPQRTKRCRVIVQFRGDVDHLPSHTRRTFYC